MTARSRRCLRSGTLRRAVACTWLVAAWLPASAARAGVPCGGVTLDEGAVRTGAALPARASLVGEAGVCAAAVAQALKARPRLRSVTVAVRVAAPQRALGAAIADAWSKVLIAAGIPADRVSAVVPSAVPGAATTVELAFREPAGQRPVALVAAATGSVQSGATVTTLTVAAVGTRLAVGDHMATAPAASARLALADGSHVAVFAASLIRLGRLELTSELKRAVGIELLRGKVEALAEFKGAGSAFDITTRVAVAGVRGTRFRVATNEADRTRIECLRGVVDVRATQGKRQSIRLTAGHATMVDAAGIPTQPVALLPAVRPVSPLRGGALPGVQLTWQPTAGAARYLLDIAADGEFATQVTTIDTATPTAAAPPSLGPGKWFWRVQAQDPSGFVGVSSKTYSFDLPVPGAP